MASTLEAVIFSGRRSPAAFLALMVLTGLWFSRKIKIPVVAIVFCGVCFFMFVMNVGIYRSLVLGSEGDVDWRKVRSEVFDVRKTIKQFSNDGNGKGGGETDALNGMVASSAVFNSFHYDYGLIGWNTLVFGYVPGQLVGHKFKQSLMIDVNSASETAYEEYEYKLDVGSCVPGYAHLFASFGFFGAVFMYFFGRFARMVWLQAESGNLLAQIVHFACAPVYLRFGGGGLWPQLNAVIFWIIFLLPILMFARERSTEHELSNFSSTEYDV